MRTTLKIFLASVSLATLNVATAATCPSSATAIQQVGAASLSAATPAPGGVGYVYSGTSSYDKSTVYYYTLIQPTTITPSHQIQRLESILSSTSTPIASDATTVTCAYLGSASGTAAPFTPTYDSTWGQAIVITSTIGSGPTPPGPTPPVSSSLVSPYVDLTGSQTGSQNNINQWDNGTGSMQPSGLTAMVTNSGIKSVHLAFVVNDSSKPCTPSWGAAYPVPTDGPNYTPADYGVATISKVVSSGVAVVVSFGGADGIYLAQSCTSPAILAAAYEQVIKAYNPSELNFDYENSIQTDKTSLDRAMNALNIVRQNHPNMPISFTLAVLPSGLTNGLLVAQEAMSILQPTGGFSIDLMTMDFGDSAAPPGQGTMGQYSIDAANATRGQLDQIGGAKVKIGIIPMVGLNDNTNENFTLADATAVAQFAKATSWVNLLSMWSLGRDAPCNISYVATYCSSATSKTSGQANQTSNFDYVHAFAAGAQ